MSTTGYGLGFTNPHKELGANSLIVQIDAANPAGGDDKTAVSGFGANTLLGTDSTELTCADDDRTWIAWIFQTDFSANRTIIAIGDNDASNTDLVFKLTTAGSGSDLRLDVSTNGTSYTNSATLTNVLKLNEFNLVMAIHNKTANTISVFSRTTSGGSGSSPAIPDGGLSGATLNDFTVGNLALKENPFNGSDSRIDKVAVYNQAFDFSLLETHYNGGLGFNASSIPKTNLISFWEFSEKAGENKVDSISSNDLIDSGTSKVTTSEGLQSQPIINMANTSTVINQINGSILDFPNSIYTFDGIDDQLIIQEDLVEIPANTDATIIFWMRRTGATANGDTVIVKYDSGLVRQWSLVNFQSLLPDQLAIQAFGGTSAQSASQVPLNEWHMITLTIKGLEMKAHVDIPLALPFTSFNSLTPLTNDVGSFILVGAANGSANAYPCDISLVLVDNRFLTTDEIIKRYNATKHRFI